MSKKLVTYICCRCLQECDADSAMPHIAYEHMAPLSAEEVAKFARPKPCTGVGFPTKRHVKPSSQFDERVQSVF